MAAELPMVTDGAIVAAFRTAVVAADRGHESAGELADALFELVASLPADSSRAVLDRLIDQIRLLPAGHTFGPTMLVGELLAGCILLDEQSEHALIVRHWATSEHAPARAAAMRTCAKLCEYDTSLVEVEPLLGLAALLDDEGEPPSDLALGYLGIVAGRLRTVDAGVRLIEQLASQG